MSTDVRFWFYLDRTAQIADDAAEQDVWWIDEMCDGGTEGVAPPVGVNINIRMMTGVGV